MIITLKGANFSTNKIGTLSNWTITPVIDSGTVYSGVRSVKKGDPFSATLTLQENYAYSNGVEVTMGGDGTITKTENGNVTTISTTSTTGNITIKALTYNTSTGGSDSGDVVDPETPVTPTNYTFTITPDPISATVTLSATGYSDVSGTGSKSITVANGTKVNWSVSASGYTTRTGNWTINGGNKTENITLTASGSGGGGTSDKLAGTWVFNNNTLTDEELTAFGGYPAKDLGLSYSAYTAYKVNFTIYKSGTEVNAEYLIKSNNNVILGYDYNGSAVGFATNGSLSSLDNRAITIHSKLSEVTGGQMLLNWLNSVATNTTNPDSNPDSDPEQPEEGGTVGADELAGTWYMNETIDATNFGGTKGSSMGYPDVTLYKGYKVNYTAGSTQSELFLTHTSVSGILAYKQLNGSAVAFLYNDGKWSKPEYRTIVITSKLSEVTDGDKLLAWMKANGTKTA